jgi:hypothetical protein
MRWISTTGVALLLSVVGTGCNRGPATDRIISLGGPTGSSTWFYAPDGGPPVPGIDEGSAYYAGRLFLVWTDSPRGTSAGGSTGGPDGFRADGGFTTRDGRRVPFECTSPDGKGGRVVIDGAAYDLAGGRLFLVATGVGKVQVKQLSKDLAGFRLESPDFRSLARGEPEVAAFFQAATK